MTSGTVTLLRRLTKVNLRIAELIEVVTECNRHSRQPIDLNYIAIPKDGWEELEATLRRLTEATRGL